MEEALFVKGMYLQTIFFNESNSYHVGRIQILETNQPEFRDKVGTSLMVVGFFPILAEDEEYRFFGTVVTHEKYGMQYQVTSYQSELPEGRAGVISYLSSGLFRGIGEKTATAIADHLGDDAIEKIIDSAEVLYDLPIGRWNRDKAYELHDQLREHHGLEKVLAYLTSHGFTTKMAMKIYNQYHEATFDKINENPYQIASDVDGIGFAKVDAFAQTIGFDKHHPKRIEQAILYVISRHCMQNGDTCMNGEQIFDLLYKQLNIDVARAEILAQIEVLIEAGKIIRIADLLTLPIFFYAEVGIERQISYYQQASTLEAVSDLQFEKIRKRTEKAFGIVYADLQVEAMRMALENPVCILTGGPGTGKTTVIRGILNALFHMYHLDADEIAEAGEKAEIQLLAPTGRAAKRMSESTGFHAQTIHRFLKWDKHEDRFFHNDENPIEDVSMIIVDESSMMDVWLMNALLRSLPNLQHLILVGDADQLPSVQPGNVLYDLLQIDSIPKVSLNTVFRQAKESTIINIAHHIRTGTIDGELFEKKHDYSFIPTNTVTTAGAIAKICANALSKGYRDTDIQVLAPMYKGTAGINQLNAELQEVFNPADDEKNEAVVYQVTYRERDKVLQLKNMPDVNVFNGDIGTIYRIEHTVDEFGVESATFEIHFDENVVLYSQSDMDMIQLAYCISIHKSQGSEFPIVIVPVLQSYSIMLYRKLIYTAITRAKQSLIVCGEMDAYRLAISRDATHKRQTLLQDMFKGSEAAAGEGEVLAGAPILDEDIPFDSIGEMGMENVTPYDFLEGDISW